MLQWFLTLTLKLHYPAKMSYPALDLGLLALVESLVELSEGASSLARSFLTYEHGGD